MKRAHNRRLPFETRRYIQQETVDFDPRLLTVKSQRTVYIEGYWQSEGYFADVEDVIRADLKIKPPTDHKNLAIAEKMSQMTSVAVHVRFFEAPDQPDVSNAPADYYGRALAAMDAVCPWSALLRLSDRPDAALARLLVPHDRITLVDHNRGDENAYADLWLMTRCRHFIIANSTFSWWGAWLADAPGKRIIAPGHESRVGSAWWGFDGLLPASWIKL